MTELYLIIPLSIAVTYIWRASGIAIAERINPDGQIFEWIGCVAYAMLAGLMARVLIFPVGVLEETELSVRIIAMGAGFVFFFIFRRNVMIATFVSVMTFYGLIQSTTIG